MIAEKQSQSLKEKYKPLIALAGNPNVGKSTLFNTLTGMHQHTGNWTGKTVGYAEGEGKDYRFVDLPGTYSLFAHSLEETVACEYLCFKKPDAVVVVVDATCLLRNLQLYFQIAEICPRTILCINLLDEAHKKGISIDLARMQEIVGGPVIAISARKKQSIQTLNNALADVFDPSRFDRLYMPSYPPNIQHVIEQTEKVFEEALSNMYLNTELPLRLFALRLLCNDGGFLDGLELYCRENNISLNEFYVEMVNMRSQLNDIGVDSTSLNDAIVQTIAKEAEFVFLECVQSSEMHNMRDRKIDKILTGKISGYISVVLLLICVFWLTVVGANYLSNGLSQALELVERKVFFILNTMKIPIVLRDFLVFGCFRVTAWVVSVMLPPMAIFFPLFSLLEDMGFLPRVAYNLDAPFRRCDACGKQALTMCMGFGCNAVGVTGCRIIDSPRERLLAILTNQFVPCNGRFPTLVLLISTFLVGGYARIAGASVLVALILSFFIIFSVCLTFLATKFLSRTFLKGTPSTFILELPPFRRPDFFRVLIRSVFDRMLFVLGRAIVVALPAGAILFFLSNTSVHDVTLLTYIADALDPFARLMGMDGVILLAFVLGAPANEIVLPIAMMMYMQEGKLAALAGNSQIYHLLVSAGWTWQTALSVLVFSICHFPCATTVLTIKKETASWKWTILAVLLPTVIGVALCMVMTAAFHLFL